MDGSIIGGLIGVAGALGAAVYAHWAARQANRRQETTQVEAEVFKRSLGHLDDVVGQQDILIARLREELERANAHIDRINARIDRTNNQYEQMYAALDRLRDQLRGERDVSQELRERVRELVDVVRDTAVSPLPLIPPLETGELPGFFRPTNGEGTKH